MDNLLAPVSDSSTVGEYLKGNRAVYRALRNTFNQAQSAYRQLMESPEAMQDNQLQLQNAECWATLAEQCQDTLINTSKDVEVMCWLTTARVYTSTPLASLAEALQVFVQMVEEFGTRMHPRPPREKLKSEDDDGQEQEWAEFRTRPLLQLLGESDNSGLLYMPLQNIPLIGEITYARYFSAERAGTMAELKAEALQLLPSERSDVISTLHDLDACKNHLDSLRVAFARQCQDVGLPAVNFGFVARLFDQLIGALRFMLEEQLTPWPLDPVEEQPVVEQAPAEPVVAEVAAETPQPEVPAAQAQPAAVAAPVATAPAAPAALSVADVSGAIQSRDQAFQNLRIIADYFRQTEPHSPVYMLLERAIRWGYMPLPELLAEMVGDNNQVMERIQSMAGLENTQQTDLPAAGAAPVTVNMPAAEATVAAQQDQAVASEPPPAEKPAEQQTIAQNISSFEW